MHVVQHPMCYAAFRMLTASCVLIVACSVLSGEGHPPSAVKLIKADTEVTFLHHVPGSIFYKTPVLLARLLQPSEDEYFTAPPLLPPEAKIILVRPTPSQLSFGKLFSVTSSKIPSADEFFSITTSKPPIDDDFFTVTSQFPSEPFRSTLSPFKHSPEDSTEEDFYTATPVTITQHLNGPSDEEFFTALPSYLTSSTNEPDEDFFTATPPTNMLTSMNPLDDEFFTATPPTSTVLIHTSEFTFTTTQITTILSTTTTTVTITDIPSTLDTIIPSPITSTTEPLLTTATSTATSTISTTIDTSPSTADTIETSSTSITSTHSYSTTGLPSTSTTTETPVTVPNNQTARKHKAKHKIHHQKGASSAARLTFTTPISNTVSPLNETSSEEILSTDFPFFLKHETSEDAIHIRAKTVPDNSTTYKDIHADVTHDDNY